MRHIVNLAIITIFSLGLYFSICNILHPPELVVAMDDSPSSDPNPVKDVSPSTPQNIESEVTGGWQVILNENFSEAWPWPGWRVLDLFADTKTIYWATDQYRYHSSNSAAWPARGGRDGRDPTVNNNDYFNNMDTRMIYGPFDLSNAVSANISFWIWWQTESPNDFLKFEISHDNSLFTEVSRWSGTSTGWQQITLSLDQLKGDNSVWVSWRFTSNSSIVYDGPWVDDILLRKYVYGSVTAHGTLSYTDRNNNPVTSPFTKVTLYDYDYNGTTSKLATTFTQLDGSFQFPHIYNRDNHDPEDPNDNYDFWIVWETIYTDSISSQHTVINFNNQSYRWYSDVMWNVLDDSDVEFNYHIPSQDENLPSMWIFQDQRRAWEYYFNNTNPNIDPGSVTVKWERTQNSLLPCNGSCFYGFGPYTFIADESTISSDSVIHEIGHNFMYNKTNGWWLWWDIGCYNHQIFSIEDQNCAWSEGWADFYPLVVNGDACYDFGIGPCTGFPDEQYYNLESHSRNDLFPFPDGDSVEGRVAGSLYDLIDFNWPYEGYDSAFYDFNYISTIIISNNVVEESFRQFWDSWKDFDFNKHHTVRAIYQNAIDYNTLPEFKTLPIMHVFMNVPKRHGLDLWEYSIDQESTGPDFIYSAFNYDNCSISISENRFVDIVPGQDWLGYCSADIAISDTINSTTDPLYILVIPLISTTYLPAITK